MAKGHMKQLWKGIWSTHCHPLDTSSLIPPSDNINHNDAANTPIAKVDNDSDVSFPIDVLATFANVIKNGDNSNANMFVSAAFADNRTGIIYSDNTGMFLFKSLEGNICFLIVYHYDTNAILALPISNFSNESILSAYQQQLERLELKGHKIKLNVMDNQASQVIKKYLTLKQCNNLLIEPNNHRVNTAEQTFQTFKAHFVSALTTTNSKFPLQLWDHLTSQVENTLNMSCLSCINPAMLVYKAIHGP